MGVACCPGNEARFTFPFAHTATPPRVRQVDPMTQGIASDGMVNAIFAVVPPLRRRDVRSAERPDYSSATPHRSLTNHKAEHQP